MLHKARFVDWSFDELFGEGRFEDWEDYLSFARQEYADRVIRKQTKELEIATTAERERALGLLPDQLFYAVEEKDEPGIRHTRYALTDKPAETAEIVKRYYRYKLLDIVTQSFPTTRGKLSPDRKVKVVLGIDPDKGTGATGFISEVKKLTEVKEVDENGKKSGNKPLITDDDIGRLVEELGAEDYIKLAKNHRKAHLDTLLKIGGWPVTKRRRSLVASSAEHLEPDPDEAQMRTIAHVGGAAVRTSLDK